MGDVVALAPPPQAQLHAPPPAAPDAPLDPARIAAWTQAVLDGDVKPIALTFLHNGAAAPEVTWDPPAPSLTAPPLRFLLDHWHRLTDAGALPRARDIDAVELRPALGHMMLLEPVDLGRDFRYRLYGGELARVSGFDMTGKCLSEHPASAYAAAFGIALYRAVMQRRRPLYTVRHPVGAKIARRWQALALPFVDDADDTRVTRLLCATVAVDRDGKII
jgi:hypothetical protein